MLIELFYRCCLPKTVFDKGKMFFQGIMYIPNFISQHRNKGSSSTPCKFPPANTSDDIPVYQFMHPPINSCAGYAGS